MNKLKIWLLQHLTKYSKKDCTNALRTSNNSFKEARSRLTRTELTPEQLQTIFNNVIDKGSYTGDVYTGTAYMCTAVTDAWYEGIVTCKERELAIKHIRCYISGSYELQTHLGKLGLDYSTEAKLNIYRNWSSRPFTKKQPS
jgi:hypothetical protein